MRRRGLLLTRLAAAAAGVVVLVAGTVFALHGSEDTSNAIPLATLPPAQDQSPQSSPAAQPTDSPPTASPTPVAPAAASATSGGPDLAATATVAPARPISQPPPATAGQPTSTPAPITDLPAYKDTQVLALAAGVVLPSGKTFEQCVALGPNGARWPVPVHLYYEGKGKWIVETHLGEIETEFDEATATFHVKHFAPEASECLH